MYECIATLCLRNAVRGVKRCECTHPHSLTRGAGTKHRASLLVLACRKISFLSRMLALWLLFVTPRCSFGLILSSRAQDDIPPHSALVPSRLLLATGDRRRVRHERVPAQLPRRWHDFLEPVLRGFVEGRQGRHGQLRGRPVQGKERRLDSTHPAR